ncbi:AAA family ATPase [Chryseobacterium gleum]|uniref:AAA family ATPase n=1 Tax=Chryseobacterium gleum TaxID=250 RepID=UPI001E2E94B9|nr:AAA family ATPase [Chryseobacterium gleum]MCD9617911.1 ATP-binding protein [Chryseobacterium gleum]
MNNINVGDTPWYGIYHSIALELQKFYYINTENPGERLYELLQKSIYLKKEETWLRNVKNSSFQSIDPIQLFISFSRSKQSESRKNRIIEEVWTSLTDNLPYWESINFDGRPSPMAIKIEYIRPEYEQKEIWSCLDNVLKNGKKSITENLWKKAMLWRGIKEASFTIFLFWIDSKNFIPLDNNTHQYLIYLRYLNFNTPLNFSNYTKLLNNKRIKNYSNLSLEGYNYLHRPNLYKKITPFNSNKDKSTGFISGFKILGIRTLKRNLINHKILKPDNYFSFDKHYRYINDSFQVNHTKFDNLYGIQDKFKLDIGAIVGKNGSGKSTLIDLVLMGIYNLSLQLKYIEDGKTIKNLNFELYWIADKIYKFVFGDIVELYEFKEVSKGGKFITYNLVTNPIDIKENIITFFYSILINYSHYALNSSETKIDWITPLSHKNDGYKTPLVINPKRTKRNININREKQLMNIRLLVNLLELHHPNDVKQSFRCIEDGKSIKYFSFHLDKEKHSQLDKNQKYNEKIKKLIIEELYSVFEISTDQNFTRKFHQEIELYLLKKIDSIISTYTFYNEKYDDSINRFIELSNANITEISNFEIEFNFKNKLREFFEDLKDDPSHISLKFKQAINYLKFPKFSSYIDNLNNQVKVGKKILLDDYHNFILSIINNNQEENLLINDFLPPSIFKIEFYLDDKDESNFSKASSGEYQLMSVLSSILYHIRNIDSVDNEYSYRYVTILLDEIELYFHPNMQKVFIKKLILSLSKLECNIWGMQILFATHSPFILSDIPQQKILKISNGEPIKAKNNYNSFAANIHDLLSDEFFLEDGSIGAFATQQIEVAINLMNYIKFENKIKNLDENLQILSVYKNNLIDLGYWNDDRFEKRNKEAEKLMLSNLIGIIGEPVIKYKLTQMYQDIFNDALIKDKQDIEEEIKQLIKDYKIDIKKII